MNQNNVLISSTIPAGFTFKNIINSKSSIYRDYCIHLQNKDIVFCI